MITIHTPQGKRIEIILQSELCDPVNIGEYVRAYCHIHGSDHQRSLSINKLTGWGHCFNALCDVTVLVAEWNRPAARRLLQFYYQGLSSASLPGYRYPGEKKRPTVYQPMLLYPVKPSPTWQRQELAALLSLDEQMRTALAEHARARAYLEERAIPLEVALETGACYLPHSLLNAPSLQKQRGFLYRWVERILFPLVSPGGKGYIGRSLWYWQPGIDENTHKSLLDQPGKPRRWIKTNPAGWFGVDLDQLPATIILVEGAFDRLTLLAAGFQAAEVVALAGTTVQLDWFPTQVKTIVLALDGDEGGTEASSRLEERLIQEGLGVRMAPPPRDGQGKDWNERWRRLGPQSVHQILAAYVHEFQ